MRTEKEMYDLILSIAKEDSRIRAVYMNGSRANPNVDKDMFRDYDIVFLVKEIRPFLEQKNWITRFGEIAIVQEPNKEEQDIYYTWLMLFTDGNRIDLHIRTIEYGLQEYVKDSLTVPLLDKDNCLPSIPSSNDSDYHIRKPTAIQYRNCCNNFWWCLQNVAKGIVRDQLPYTMWMYHHVVREDLHHMLNWYIGAKNDFSVTTGMGGKYYKKYLETELYEQYRDTYSSSEYKEIWNSIDNMCALFSDVAQFVGKELGFSYYHEEERNMIAYLEKMKQLKK
ncbi:aminoglycoside 6-adenylyltransferase [Gracilibacillus marinus]|uniref:Aminoglycoside 6-adenylyltransferase n=1 Tax=Gracilibacillus marinus TaxID=630535 RepID=A0ABV8VXP2_9BACI